MEYARLGKSGLKVSRICLGMMSFGNPSPDHPSWRAWHLEEDAAEPIVRRAVEGGVTFFDTADSYAAGASERATGGLLRKFLLKSRITEVDEFIETVERIASGGCVVDPALVSELLRA